MENRLIKRHQQIAELYLSNREKIYRFFVGRIHSPADAEDLTQDVFVRLLEHNMMFCSDTVEYLLFTIARNLLNDYLRRYYKRQEISTYLYNVYPVASDDTENRVLAADLQLHELRKMSQLPPQRRKIYQLARFEEKSVSDIALQLELSFRTVENHLRIGRKEVREYMRRCM